MQLPHAGSSAQTHYLYGRYTVRLLARAGLIELEAAVGVVNEEIRRLARELEDLEVPIEDAICDRDYVDVEFDDTVRLVRNQMIGRGVGMEKQEPMISILPNGLAEYTEANLGDELARYGLLLSRLETHLPETDPIRVEQSPRLRRLLEEWKAAVGAVDQARQAQDAARRRLQQAIARWTTVMHEVYGTLVARFGSRKAADRFFRRTKRTRIVPVEAAVTDLPN